MYKFWILKIQYIFENFLYPLPVSSMSSLLGVMHYDIRDPNIFPFFVPNCVEPWLQVSVTKN